jgi:hypothetical protein
VYRATGSEPSVPSFTLEVDGELFAIRPDEQGGTNYMVERAEQGLRIRCEPTPNQSLEAHRESIRTFLAQIDPTGYIADD